ncbi:MAG: proline--tRNA ligase, partial [Anaerolineae bacterium]
QASGRWYEVDDEMGRFQDKNGRQMVLAMTHEEVVTRLARHEIQSYRQLPQLVYHFQTKWRDDPRPRAGLIRAREFSMLDSYSLDADDAGLDAVYRAHEEAYVRIFQRCSLPVITVEADVGMMGGKLAHEYMYLTPIGEDTLLFCDACGYRANRQIAVFRKHQATQSDHHYFIADVVENRETIQRLVLAVVADGKTVNETKLTNCVNAQRIRPADDEQVREMHEKQTLIVVDDAVADTAVSLHTHHTADITAAEDGDACPTCGAAMQAVRGVEVANIFKLGTRFTKAMGAAFMDKHGRLQPIIMGSYGIGVTRLLAALAEHYHDERGLCWPAAVAPYQVHLLALRGGEETAESLYRQLRGINVEVLYDDRQERPGVKFNDADLMGLPLRITVGQRSLQQGSAEITLRQTGKTTLVGIEDVLQKLAQFL